MVKRQLTLPLTSRQVMLGSGQKHPRISPWVYNGSKWARIKEDTHKKNEWKKFRIKWKLRCLSLKHIYLGDSHSPCLPVHEMGDTGQKRPNPSLPAVSYLHLLPMNVVHFYLTLVGNKYLLNKQMKGKNASLKSTAFIETSLGHG